MPQDSLAMRQMNGIPVAAARACYLTLVDASTNRAKFWTAHVLRVREEIVGPDVWRVVVTWGRIGTGGQQQIYEHAQRAWAEEEFEERAAKKLHEGYKDGPPPPPAALLNLTVSAQQAVAALAGMDAAFAKIADGFRANTLVCPLGHETQRVDVKVAGKHCSWCGRLMVPRGGVVESAPAAATKAERFIELDEDD